MSCWALLADGRRSGRAAAARGRSGTRTACGTSAARWSIWSRSTAGAGQRLPGKLHLLTNRPPSRSPVALTAAEGGFWRCVEQAMPLSWNRMTFETTAPGWISTSDVTETTVCDMRISSPAYADLPNSACAGRSAVTPPKAGRHREVGRFIPPMASRRAGPAVCGLAGESCLPWTSARSPAPSALSRASSRHSGPLASRRAVVRFGRAGQRAD